MHFPKKKKEAPPVPEEVVAKYLFSCEELSQQDRVALFVVSLLNFSVEAPEVTEGVKCLAEVYDIEQSFTDVDGRCSWNVDIMMMLSQELHIPEQFIEMYRDLLPTQFSRKKSDLHDAYLTALSSPSSGIPSLCNILIVSKLAIFLIANGFYNARGRAYIQNICAVMHITNYEYVLMERNISKGLSHIQASLSRLQQGDDSKKKSHDYKRYAKIGAVSVGAGALLAITGGLAAPAVAAALVVFGTSTAAAAAALTSATVMSGLFGSAGMGLAGYKMAKRTRGISEFVFESEENFGSKYLLTESENDLGNAKEKEKEGKGNKLSSLFEKSKKDELLESETKNCKINHLSVMICVSGWMIDKEDYKKSFGIVPHDMQDEERLRRFYEIHCPQKIDRAAEDIRAWKSSACTSGSASMVTQGQGEKTGSSFSNLKKSVTSSFGGISTAVGGGNDMDEFYQNLTEIYGADPRVVESLVPPPLFPTQTSENDLPPPQTPDTKIDSSEDEMMTHILESITIALDNKKRIDDRKAKLKNEGEVYEEVKLRLRSPIASPKKIKRKTMMDSGKDIPDSDDEEKEGHEETFVGENDTSITGERVPTSLTETSTAHDESNVATEDGKTNESNVELEVVSNDTQARLESDFWHWNQTELSGVYELNLLRWETPMQLELGKCIQQMLKDLTEAVATKVLQATVLAALMTAVIVPYSLMKFMDKIDNIWDIATERADAAGIMLAHVLLKRPQGSRSVTLVGHSIGARLVFSCLQELYRCKQIYLEERVAACRREAKDSARRAGVTLEKRKEKKSFTSSMVSGMKSVFADDDDDDIEDIKDKEWNNKESKDGSTLDSSLDLIDRRLANRPSDVEDFTIYDFKHADNIVQDVVLLGTLNSTSRTEYKKARAVVTDRFINGYSKNDYILALIYRYNKLAIKVAGLQEIHVNGIENIDFSDMVKKHTDYCLNMEQILEHINLLGAANPANMYLEGDDIETDAVSPPPIASHDTDGSLDDVTHG